MTKKQHYIIVFLNIFLVWTSHFEFENNLLKFIFNHFIILVLQFCLSLGQVSESKFNIINYLFITSVSLHFIYKASCRCQFLGRLDWITLQERCLLLWSLEYRFGGYWYWKFLLIIHRMIQLSGYRIFVFGYRCRFIFNII